MNDFSWLDEYLLCKLGVTKDYKEEWGWHRYMVGGKMFAATMHPSEKYNPMYAGKDLLNLKCDSLLAQVLRSEHEEIMPGFYSDKASWNSLDLGGKLEQDFIKNMCDSSYKIIFSKLTKKLQKEIIDEGKL